MSEKSLTKEQKEKIEALREQWLEEVEPYLEDGHNPQPVVGARLDGPDTVALAKIQAKYKRKIKEVIDNN